MADPHIQIKNYEHFNRAMGKQIRNKAHYEEEMKKGGYCTFEQGEKLASKNRAEHKDYKGLSSKAKAVVDTVRQQNKKNFKLSDRAIDAMKDLGVKFTRKNLPIDRRGFK